MVTQWLAGQDITVDRLNDNHPRSIMYTGITANTATTTTTETTAITTSTFTMRNNRAFRVTAKALIQSSVAADTMTIRIRRTNTSGATILDTQRIYAAVASANTLCYAQNIFTNTTGSDITDVLVLDYLRASGTGNVLVAASASQVAYIEVEDIGVAADFPSATAIT